MPSPHKALAAFAEDPDLQRLEGLLKRFNLSPLPAFLLDPCGNHNLGAAFLEALLQATSDWKFTDLGKAAVQRDELPSIKHAFALEKWLWTIQ